MIEFLKCDAPGCDHREQAEELTEDMIGRPCPKCSANLLTREDFEAWKPMREMMQLLQSLGVAMPIPEGGVPDGAARLTVGHHAGKTTVEIDR